MTECECDEVTDFESSDGSDHSEDEHYSADAEVEEEGTWKVLLLNLSHEVRPEAFEHYRYQKHQNSQKHSSRNIRSTACCCLIWREVAKH